MSIEELKPKKKAIIKALLESNIPLSTTQIAKRAGISWNTAERELRKMDEKKWVKRDNIGRKVIWKTKIIKKLKKK